MATMHYDGNFNAEKGRLDAIDQTLTAELNAMRETVNGMTYWKDEKSEEFKASTTEAIADLESKKESAIASGKNVLDQVEAALEIYK